MSSHHVTMSDIASELGVSIVTVSNALRDKDGVSEGLKHKIQKTAAELGYQHKTAVGRKNKGSVAVVIAERYLVPEHSFYLSLYLKTAEALTNAGYHNTLEVVSAADEQASLVPDFIVPEQEKGIMVLGPMKTAYLKALERIGLPMVLTDFYDNAVSAVSVVTDSFLGSYDMTQYLIGKGHTRIGYVGSIQINANARDRYYGYCKAMEEAGLSMKTEWIIPDREGVGFKDVFELPSDMPTAFVCNNDQSAYHFSRYITNQGYKIPEDISITGFYNNTFSLLSNPPVTTFCTNAEAIATEAVRVQKMLIAGETELPPRVIVSGKIVERCSVSSRKDA